MYCFYNFYKHTHENKSSYFYLELDLSTVDVIWYKENRRTLEKEKIKENYKFALKHKEELYTLTIKNVQGNDYGDYYCTVKNKYGKNQVLITLFGICISTSHRRLIMILFIFRLIAALKNYNLFHHFFQHL